MYLLFPTNFSQSICSLNMESRGNCMSTLGVDNFSFVFSFILRIFLLFFVVFGKERHFSLWLRKKIWRERASIGKWFMVVSQSERADLLKYVINKYGTTKHSVLQPYLTMPSLISLPILRLETTVYPRLSRPYSHCTGQ